MNSPSRGSARTEGQDKPVVGHHPDTRRLQSPAWIDPPMTVNDRLFVAATVALVGYAAALTAQNTSVVYRWLHRPPTPAIHFVQDRGVYAATGTRLGALDPKVQVIVFTDFECPACRQFDARLTRLMRENEGRIGVVLHHYPLPSHLHARGAAAAELCAGAQGRPGAFHGLIFTIVLPQDSMGWRAFAEQIKVPDVPAFTRCLGSRWADSLIEADVRLGDRLGVNATPTFLVDDSLYSGVPWDLQRILTARLAQVRPAAQETLTSGDR